MGKTISFEKHDFGCTVTSRAGPVTMDFDGARNGEMVGFDLKNLITFINSHHTEYGFESSEEIVSMFKKAVEAGKIVRSVADQYGLSEADRYY